MCGIKEPSIGVVKMSGFTYENNNSEIRKPTTLNW